MFSRAAKIVMLGAAALGLSMVPGEKSAAQERLPWENRDAGRIERYDDRRDVQQDGYSSVPNDGLDRVPLRRRDGLGGGAYAERGRDDAYRPPRYDGAGAYESPNGSPGRYGGDDTVYGTDRYGSAGPYRDDGRHYGRPYEPPATYERGDDYAAPGASSRYDRYGRYDRYDDYPRDGTFSMREIRDAGHSFFGSISQGLASVIEYAFQRQGRPNGYILGEDLGGAFVAGLRYGEGVLYTKDAGNHKVYWQGPSIGYDAGAEGSKVMVLVYNIRDPSDIYRRFGGVAGSAYVVGGVGLTFQSHGDIILAPIRSGIGLRLGANIGYLKYTRRPTWNPF